MRDPYVDPAEPARWWQVVLGGLLFAAATFGFLWALPMILWALESAS